MPGKTDARREVLLGVGKGLAVVTQSEVEREVAMQVHVVLNKQGVEPLRQLIAADAEVDRLRVVLYVVECQLTERRRRVAPERECAEDRGTRFAAGTAGSVMDDAEIGRAHV